jgi:hypothetical protein
MEVLHFLNSVPKTKRDLLFLGLSLTATTYLPNIQHVRQARRRLEPRPTRMNVNLCRRNARVTQQPLSGID